MLATPAAGRLSEEQRAGVEEELAARAADYTPAQLRSYGTDLIERLDQDGPAPDDRPPVPVNTLQVRRFRDRPGGPPGGELKGQFEDAAMFDTIATLLDAKSKPLDSDDRRGAERRQADALADICGYVLDHGDVPDTGGRRPHLTVLIRLEDLE
ncbi:DUF222 domain-containing protein, partial [Pseudonocardia nigra]|uniref:DUF222 domain-containing protein n=1 Tax=Pseudonocardia nigra TaxID=1921578 RepID=UPI001C5E4A01